MRHALKLVMQNDGDFVDVTLIYVNVQKVLFFSFFFITTGMLVSIVKNHKGILLHSVFNVFNPYVFHYSKSASYSVLQNIPASPLFAMSFGSCP